MGTVNFMCQTLWAILSVSASMFLGKINTELVD